MVITAEGGQYIMWLRADFERNFRNNKKNTKNDFEMTAECLIRFSMKIYYRMRFHGNLIFVKSLNLVRKARPASEIYFLFQVLNILKIVNIFEIVIRGLPSSEEHLFQK